MPITSTITRVRTKVLNIRKIFTLTVTRLQRLVWSVVRLSCVARTPVRCRSNTSMRLPQLAKITLPRTCTRLTKKLKCIPITSTPRHTLMPIALKLPKMCPIRYASVMLRPRSLRDVSSPRTKKVVTPYTPAITSRFKNRRANTTNKPPAVGKAHQNRCQKINSGVTPTKVPKEPTSRTALTVTGSSSVPSTK